MVRYSNDKKQLTAKEIVDRLGVGYYEVLIDECQTRISNILSGNGDKSKEYTYKEDSGFKNRVEKERKVEQLRKQIKNYEEIIREINEAINTINHSVFVLEQAAERQALIGGLSHDLRECFLKYEDKKENNGNLIRIPSDTYDAIFKNKMFENAKSKYRRLWSKENNKVNAETRKVKKDIYKKLKKIYNRSVVDESNRYGYSSRDRYDYNSLNGTLKDNNYSLEGFAGRLYANIGDKYDSWNVDTLAPLGVEVSKVKRAYDIANGAERTFDQFGPILKSMEYLASEYQIQNRFKTFYYLKEDIREVDKLSREVECLDLIIDAYDNTIIKDTELFKELVEIYRKQNNKLNKMSRKVEEMYSRSGMKEFLEAEAKLKDLSAQRIRLQSERVRTFDEFGEGPSFDRSYQVEERINAEMLGILLKYPELNKPIYGINLEDYNRRGKYIGDRGNKKKDYSESSRPIVVEEEIPFIPTVVVTEEELKRDLGIVEEPGVQETKRPWKPVDETPEEENSLEIPDTLVSLRTAYYSRYMVEKVRNSELGRMSFSEYLEEVAPELEELIEIEKRRENSAKNVFKLYVQYLASLEDKSQAMRFSEFARLRHGLEQDDLPYEYSDAEVKKRLSL